MSHATYLVGDVFDRLKELPDDSVDLVVTSPPFLALRSYLPADHPDKTKEIGSEPTPAAFIDTMLALSAELRRVLAPHGSIAVELGDTYAGSGGAGGDYAKGGTREGQPKWRGYDGRGPRDTSDIDQANVGLLPVNAGSGWPLAKSKTLIPEMYCLALAYGINPLTGQKSPAGQWRIRNVVTWCRPNPPVGALGDKWRPATSDIVVACVSGKRYWDDIATRRELKAPDASGIPRAGTKLEHDGGNRATLGTYDASMSSGAPLLDYWEIPPGGYSGSHYAVFPSSLIIPLIKAMAPPKVCRTCGEPSRRIVEQTNEEYAEAMRLKQQLRNPSSEVGLTGITKNNKAASMISNGVVKPILTTTGFTDCGHNNYRPALVLDPFAGSGTTLMVATGHGHDAIGIDLDERNADLARERIGDLFLTVVAA